MKPRSLVQFPSESLAFVSFHCHRLATLLTPTHHLQIRTRGYRGNLVRLFGYVSKNLSPVLEK